MLLPRTSFFITFEIHYMILQVLLHDSTFNKPSKILVSNVQPSPASSWEGNWREDLAATFSESNPIAVSLAVAGHDHCVIVLWGGWGISRCVQ